MNLIIFDVDGTLARTVEVDAECYVRAFAEEFQLAGIDTDWSTYADYTDDGIAREIFLKKLGRRPSPGEMNRLVDRFISLLEEAFRRKPALFAPVPGAGGAIGRLEKEGSFRLAIATGCWRKSAQFKLRSAGLKLDHLPMANSDESPVREEIVRLAIEKARREAGVERFDRTVYVGDGVWDVRTTRAIGIPFLGVGDEKQVGKMRAEGARHFIPDFRDFGAFLAGLNAATVPEQSAL